MKYKDFQGPVQELVRMKLGEIEQKEQVRIIHAVESGSRAWGFASPDSDYDVRFVYVRPLEYYLGLQDKKDTIEWELDETLDINGWDLAKVLRHFHKSNAVLYEWSDSPIVYRTTPEWGRAAEAGRLYFSCKSAMYHYYGTANKNFREHLLSEKVKYKKYFYVLRPILACQWIEEKSCPPPVLFNDLMEETLAVSMRPAVDKLLREKVQMSEGDKGERIDEINAYIVDRLAYYKDRIQAMEDNRKAGWEELNGLFAALVCGRPVTDLGKI